MFNVTTTVSAGVDVVTFAENLITVLVVIGTAGIPGSGRFQQVSVPKAALGRGKLAPALARRVTAVPAVMTCASPSAKSGAVPSSTHHAFVPLTMASWHSDELQVKLV